MKTNTICILICLASLAVLFGTGALATAVVSNFSSRWIAVCLLTLVAIVGLPTFETRFLCGGILFVSSALAISLKTDLMLYLLGGIAGASLLFRDEFTNVLTWIYPPLGKPPSDS